MVEGGNSHGDLRLLNILALWGMVIRAALNSLMILISVHFEGYHILVSFLLRTGQIVPGSLYISVVLHSGYLKYCISTT